MGFSSVSKDGYTKRSAYFAFDNNYRKQGYSLIAGVDEAGRGCWAGPVVAAALIFPADFYLIDLKDSKLLSPEKREKIFDLMLKTSISWGVGIVEREEIDRINIHQASLKAMFEALQQLSSSPQLVLVDGCFPIPKVSFLQEILIKGDQRSASIAGASVLAKVIRDRLMRKLDKVYPEYNFAIHKGYGTRLHQQALEKHGPCPLHRRSFAPIKGFF